MSRSEDPSPDSPRPRVTAVFFDGRGTLFDLRAPRHELYARVASEFGDPIDPDLLNKVMETADQEFAREWKGGFRFTRAWFREYVARVLEEAGFRGDLEPCIEGIIRVFSDPSTFRLFPDVKETLATLRERGVRLGVISNWGEDLRRILEGLGILHHFSVALDSATERLEKPDPALFRRALERMGASPGEALHVGDDPDKDARAARSQGMTGVLLDRSGGARFEGPTIRSLSELLALIG
jgi:putative hydrolase of the HAD superfamily